MNFGLDDKTIGLVKGVFLKYPEVESVTLYGSRATGKFTQGSDIDLTIKGTSIDISVLSRISSELDDLLIPYTFDLSSFSDIDNPDLPNHIKSFGIIFYKKGE
ncbi:MAG: nucleotidyltransferase domain-containing protein [Rickettsiales bacterium]|nr:nucleotidyltransferase domain-containing protein [Pseudomonadota bacterium]MDA0966037.1 nucleotidyltransferase domain-containing protein [Pseudomonadota bacterium]MDG4542492.1 nucleotidyltransferase domain-containing protein [Rickettsiales bacterium]MDG4544996.1 nucleotidyltransferase domain-containing protein [Rickettsiales bacterium]MDG4547119.1 nucleotidyltransferase domain-containing protein [Rickettsiales bacterium]